MVKRARWGEVKAAKRIGADLPESDRETVRRWYVVATPESAVDARAPVQRVTWPATAAPVGEPPLVLRDWGAPREALEWAGRVWARRAEPG